MDMVSIDSSHLRAVGYDPKDEELRVEFSSGAVFVYEGVPEAVFDGLMSSASKGSYFHGNIRNVYPNHEV